MIIRKARGHVLVSIGLLAMAAYELVLRNTHAPVLTNDFVHGTWLGACVGLEILGLMTMNRGRGQRAA